MRFILTELGAVWILYFPKEMSEMFFFLTISEFRQLLTFDTFLSVSFFCPFIVPCFFILFFHSFCFSYYLLLTSFIPFFSPTLFDLNFLFYFTLIPCFTAQFSFLDFFLFGSFPIPKLFLQTNSLNCNSCNLFKHTFIAKLIASQGLLFLRLFKQ